MFKVTDSVGKMATSLPTAATTLYNYGIDYCCGGGKTLEEACEKRGVDPQEILDEILAASNDSPEFINWDERTPQELVRHLVEAFHKPHREALPELLFLANKVETVHADKHDCPRGLTKYLQNLHETLEAHMKKEEEILFPLIESEKWGDIGEPIESLTKEHTEYGIDIDLLRGLIDNYRLPPEACNTWTVLYQGLEKMEKDIKNHISLENNILFPKVLAQKS